MLLLAGRDHAADPSGMAARAEDDIGDRNRVVAGLEPAEAQAMIAGLADRSALAVNLAIPLSAAVTGRADRVELALARPHRDVVQRMGVVRALAGQAGSAVAPRALLAPAGSRVRRQPRRLRSSAGCRPRERLCRNRPPW